MITINFLKQYMIDGFDYLIIIFDITVLLNIIGLRKKAKRGKMKVVKRVKMGKEEDTDEIEKNAYY